MAAPTVKICGLQTRDAVQAVAALSADQAGFVFAKSKRQVTAAQAADLLAALRESKTGGSPLAVGVFVNPSFEELEQTLTTAPLDVVQLHGGEDAAFCLEVKRRFGVQVYKVISVSAGAAQPAQHPSLEAYSGVVDAVLLDTFDPEYGGGSGKTFAWDCIPDYLAEARRVGVKLIVAGGLHADNVAELITNYRPDGVDVSSGVETEGVKDLDKIRKFLERVKSS